MKKARKQNINKPHDHYFRQAMSNPHVAREFFESHLPQELLKHIDLNYLESYQESFIDNLREENIVDILFKTKFADKEILLYLLTEHQSTPCKLMPLRMLRYQLNAITHHMKITEKKEIPLIIPLVVYHGKKPWIYSRNIKDLVSAPRWLIDKYFLQPFQLIDLNTIDDEQLKRKIWSGTMALTLKHIFKRDFLPYLPEIAKLLKKIHSRDHSYAESTWFYIINVTEISDKQEFYDIIKKDYIPEAGEKIMTFAEHLRQEGWEQGIQQGMQQGMQQGKLEEQRNLIKRMFSKGLNSNEIAQLTDLPVEEIYAAADLSQVETAITREKFSVNEQIK